MSFKPTLAFAIFALVFLGAQATELENCAVESVDTAFFNMCPYARRDPVELDSSGMTVTFTLGTGHTPSCNGSSQVWGVVELNPLIEGSCYEIAVDAPVLTFVNSDDSDSGLVSTFPVNPANPYNNSLIVILYCDPNGDLSDTTNFTIATNLTTANAIYVTATSYYGCPYATLNKIIDFLSDYKYPFVGVAVVLGIFLLLFGFRLFPYAVFIITCVAGTLFSAMLFFEFTKFGSQQWILWVIFGACLIIGIVLGYLAVRYERFGFFCLGAGLGVVLGLFVFNAVLIYVLQGKTVLFYVIIAVLGVIGGGLGVWLWKDIIIIGTSLIGSYLGVRAVSVLIGGFPNELAVVEGVTNLNAVAYAYLAVIVVIAIGGIYYQYREKRRLEEEADVESVSAFYRKQRD